MNYNDPIKPQKQ